LGFLQEKKKFLNVLGPSKKAQQQQNKNIISILDLFGFEDFVENSFEQVSTS
jgi:myosin heavy subunit